jgi:murein DD-endopeptidase MepM/ murein hydrolase activator NlpD
MGAVDIGDPQSLNLFAYVQNNPIDFVDPSGLFMIAPRRQQSWLEMCWIMGICGNPNNQIIVDSGDEFDSGGSPPEGEPAKDEHCGLNPITKEPGILNDKPSKRYPAKNPQGTGRQGKRGNIRAGNGGLGGFEERSGGGHNGIDIASPLYQLVYASLDGVVKRANQVKGLGKTPKERSGPSQNYGWGGLIVINYDEMALNGAYAHLYHVYVKEGDKVKAGQLIGLTGRTGNANNPSQPPEDDHLHYGRFTGEYKGGSLSGKPWIDPQKSLNSKCPPKPRTN